MRRHKLYPEPGAWVIDNYQRLPRIDPPKIFKLYDLTTKQVADLVEYEGLGYCIFSYISSEKIRDKALALKWKKAREAMLEVVLCLDREDGKPGKVKGTKAKRLKLGRTL